MVALKSDVPVEREIHNIARRLVTALIFWVHSDLLADLHESTISF